MAIEAKIYQALGQGLGFLPADPDWFSYFNNRVAKVYPDFAPESALTDNVPYLTYSQISGFGRQNISDVDSMLRLRFQINCWAKQRLWANRLARDVETYLRDYADGFYSVAIDDGMSVFDDQWGWYGSHRDFRIYVLREVAE